MSERRWSREGILFLIRDWKSLYGETPRVKEWEHDPCYPTQAVVRYHFGSWKAAMVEAGCTPRGRGAPAHRVPTARVNGRFVKN